MLPKIFNEGVINTLLSDYAREATINLEDMRKINTDLLQTLCTAIALEKIGALNAIERRSILSKNNNAYLIQKLKDLNTYSNVKELFPTAILVSDYDFMNLCKKYNLRISNIEQYIGTIPNDVLKYLLQIKNSSSLIAFNNNIIKCTNYDQDSSLRNSSLSVYNILRKCPFVRYKSVDTGGYYHGISVIDPTLSKEDNDFITMNLCSVRGIEYDSNTMFIAAPYDEIDEKGYEAKLERITDDPIVFKYINAGIIVFAKWGEEENDRLLLP